MMTVESTMSMVVVGGVVVAVVAVVAVVVVVVVAVVEGNKF
jgi:hypothetical protein